MPISSHKQAASDDRLIDNLLKYCIAHDVTISASIAVKRVPGRGLGMYASREIRKGETLMHVPSTALFTTASVPTSFLPRASREELSVHSLLAAYLTFGDASHMKDWMATWPSLTDLTDSIPLFWPLENFKEHDLKHNGNNQQNPQPEHRNHKDKKARTSPLPELAGAVIEDKVLFHLPPSVFTGQLQSKQTQKFLACLQSINKVFRLNLSHPQSPSDLSTYYRFVHMWTCVNTRCFYYLFPSQAPPEDSDEAMALCPGMDLFNHADCASVGCSTRFDGEGYSVVARQDYNVGEELLLNYGNHDNDTLWTEYGFMMDDNLDDYMRIDTIVLEHLTASQKDELADQGYLGENYLHLDASVCYRTEVAAWVTVLRQEAWYRLLHGSYDPTMDIKGTFTNGLSPKTARNKEDTRQPSKSVKKGDPDEFHDNENPLQTLEQRMRATLSKWMHDLNDRAEEALLRFSSTEHGSGIPILHDSPEQIEAQAQYHKSWQEFISPKPPKIDMPNLSSPNGSSPMKPTHEFQADKTGNSSDDTNPTPLSQDIPPENHSKRKTRSTSSTHPSSNGIPTNIIPLHDSSSIALASNTPRTKETQPLLNPTQIQDRQKSQTEIRKILLIRRWEQIRQMSANAIERFRD